ncbi:hypothetical protein NDA18_003741 [Ustilago nuda]|nr:hypothetical protein NDA18_003741 [Ustilago nuda]
MTRASTSAANFGLLLVALVLTLHSVVGELIPRHVSHHLFARQDISEQCAANLAPNLKEYQNKCEVENEPRHPCFTHWAGDLNEALICGLVDQLDVKKSLFFKDEQRKDFTIKDATKSFVIKYPQLGAELLYFNYNPKTGCKDITLRRGSNEKLRIWVADEDENGNVRDIDTWNHAETTKTLCTKWIRIHIKYDGKIHY